MKTIKPHKNTKQSGILRRGLSELFKKGNTTLRNKFLFKLFLMGGGGMRCMVAHWRGVNIIIEGNIYVIISVVHSKEGPCNTFQYLLYIYTKPEGKILWGSHKEF